MTQFERLKSRLIQHYITQGSQGTTAITRIIVQSTPVIADTLGTASWCP